MKHLIVFLLLNTLSLTLHADTNKWTLKRDVQGVRIYQQPSSPGHDITRGMTEMNTSLDAVLSLMRDSKACPRWLYSCKSNRTIRSDTPAKRLDYTIVKSPLFFADRDMYVYSSSQFDKASKTLTIRNAGRENYDKGQPNLVRVKSIQAFWQLKQIAPGRISVLYQLSSNPQLMKTSFLDSHVVDSVFHTLRNLERVSQQAPYKHAKLPELH